MLMRVMGSFLTAGQLDRTIRYGLVRVHLGLGPAPRLPNAQGEMVVEFSGDDLVRCRDDQANFLFGQLSQIVLSQIVIRFRTHKSFCPEKGPSSLVHRPFEGARSVWLCRLRGSRLRLH